MPLALTLPRGDQWYLLRKPLIRRDKGDTLSLLVQFLLKLRVPCAPHVCMSMYVYMVTHLARVSTNRVRLPILLVVSWTKNKIFHWFPFAPENLVSRDGFGNLVPRQPAHLHTQAESGAYLRDSSRFPQRCSSLYFNCHTPSGQFRVYRITQLRTDGVHCRESAGTKQANLRVVPNGCCLGRSPWTIWYEPLFLTPTIGMKRACWKYRVVWNVSACQASGKCTDGGG